MQLWFLPGAAVPVQTYEIDNWNLDLITVSPQLCFFLKKMTVDN